MSAKPPYSVYFIADKRRRYVKIGISRDPYARPLGIQAASPLQLRLDLIVQYSNAVSFEDALHQHFAAHWLHHEWFAYHRDIKAYVKRWKLSNNPCIPPPLIPQPPHSCKQVWDEQGAWLRKDEYLATLRDKARAP